MLVPILVILAIVVVVILIFAGIYNGLVGARNQVKNAWAQIDVQLKRRHDLIPNLVETVKGYMQHERGTLEAVTNARTSAIVAPAHVASSSKSPWQTSIAEDCTFGKHRISS